MTTISEAMQIRTEVINGLKTKLKLVNRAQMRAVLEIICRGVNYGGCSKGDMIESLPKIATGRPYMTDYGPAVTLEKLTDVVLEIAENVRIAQERPTEQPRFTHDEYVTQIALVKERLGWGLPDKDRGR
jgi:hypothetical protein